jgi:hypothetical protein
MRPPDSRRLSRSIRERLTYANVMASVALFVALGGASYAAVSLPRDSVGTQQLRGQAVTRSKLAPGSVDTRQLRDRAVDASKLALGGVKKHSLSPWLLGQLARRSEPGPQGARGATGPRGPGAIPVRYSQPASGTPNPQPVLDVAGLSFTASCDVSAGTTTLNFVPRSSEGATLHETVTVDSGTDLANPGGPAFTGNLQIDLPAGTTLPTGGPSAISGYTRVAVQGVYSAPGTTIDLHLFATVNADAGRCSIDGVAVPA